MQTKNTKLVTIEQLSVEEGISASRLYSLVREKVLPPGVVVRFGRSIRISSDAYAEWVAAGGSALPGGWRRDPAA
jgi:predicted DNA-binding transcriptional regulator AlpA